ncbi:hypothetical protein [Sphingomonas sp. MMS24-J13]|uniref:hypothetical protein n=1 Tax=Sphingomonas sp. MMS24-J13 TaxID=3238686 RepID=UPI00384F59D8
MAKASAHFEIVNAKGKTAAPFKFTDEDAAQDHRRALGDESLAVARVKERVVRTVTVLPNEPEPKKRIRSRPIRVWVNGPPAAR